MNTKPKERMNSPRRLAAMGALSLVSLLPLAHANAALGSVDLVAKREASAATAPSAGSADIVVQPLIVAAPKGVAAPITITAAPQRWEIRRDESTLAVALRRWAKDAGYELVWSAPKELAGYPMQTTGTFAEALHRIMLDTASTSYPLRTCLYLNNIARVIQAAQSCKR
ncbi:MAG: TcpQ domain-containing protein [Cupriavidus necator]